MTDRVRLDGIDVDQLEHLRGELARRANDLHEGSHSARHLGDAITSITHAIETGRGTTVNDWTTDTDRQSEPQTETDDWEPK